MEENSELEEGEACYYKEDDGNIDPDIALSYIDEKIQHVLGHFQKDFEGGVSAENLGAKFGGYGSFLPITIWSRPKTPQRSSGTPRSPNNLSMEGASQNLKAPSNAPTSARLGTASCSGYPMHNSGLPSMDVSVKQDSHFSSAKVAKDESSNKSGNPADQRTLKVRIKVGSDNIAKNNAAIYSGLGLDNSPSSSLGNSPEGSGGMLPVSRETENESPTSILQVMTSFPLPGDVLISPLHDSLRCLMGKDSLSRDSKPVTSLNGSQEHSAVLADGQVSFPDNGKQLKEKKAKLVGKGERTEELKHGNCMNFEKKMTFLVKEKLQFETQGSKEVLTSDLKCTPLSNSVDVGKLVKATGKASEVSREANKDGLRDRFFSSDSVREDSLESFSGLDGGKRNAQSGSVEKVREQRVVNSCKDVIVHLKDNGSSKGNKISAPLKAKSSGSKCKEDLNVGAVAFAKQKVGQKGTFHVQDEIDMPCGKEKLPIEGKKKPKGIQSSKKAASKKAAAFSTNENSRVGVGVASKDTMITGYGDSTCKSKTPKLKLHKHIAKDRDNHRDSLDTHLEQTNNRVDLLERPSGNKTKNNSFNDFEKEQNAFLNKSKERLSVKKSENQLVSGAPVKDALHAGTRVTENGLASEVAPLIVDAVVLDNWVCCDSCQRWRLLPFGTMPEQLPEKWLCSMLNWLPGMNRCDISEEETTKALNALYQIPVSQNNHANETASGVTSAPIQHPDQNHPSLSSHTLSIRGKKKYGLKEMPRAGGSSGPIHPSKSTKNQLQESVKSRSLNDMNQCPADPNVMRKSSFHQLSKSQHLVGEKHIPKQKEKHVNGGDTKQIKMKNKREVDHYRHGISKKTKMEDMYSADNHRNSDVDIGRVGLSSSADLPIKKSGKNMQKFNEYSFSDEVKCDSKDRRLVSMKKPSDQPQVSSDGGSLGLTMCDKRNSSEKKRKLKDSQDSENGHDKNVYAKEESSESGFRKEKQSRVSKTEGKESSTNNGDDRSNRKGMVIPIYLPGSRDHPVGGMEEIRSIDKGQQLRKDRRKIASQQALDGVDSLRKNLGSGQASMTATSSSSKVSGSHKTKANFEETKGSPVESVSSSPLRTSHQDVLMPTVGDALRKDDAVNGDRPMIGTLRRCWDGEGNGEINQSGTTRKEKVSCGFRPGPHKFSRLDYQDGDANHKISTNAKPSSEFENSHLFNGDADKIDHRHCPSDLHAMEPSYNEDRVKKNYHDNVLFYKPGKGSRLKGYDRNSASDFDANKMKVSDPMSEQGNSYSKRNVKYESEVDLNHHASSHETMSDVKHNFPDKSSMKSGNDEKNHVGRNDSVRQWSSGSRMENSSKLEEHADSNAKLSDLSCKEGKVGPKKKLIQEGESKADSIQMESISGISKLFSHCEGESKQETRGLQPVPGSQQGDVFNGLPVDASGNGDASKVLRKTGNCVTENGARHNLGHATPDSHGVRDLTSSSPSRLNSSSWTATKALKEAKDLRDYADRLKSSGFGFESNEAYFQAALKFLHGASLLETCNSESGRQGEMTQMQVYSTTVKLCESCAHEYERRQEMAAAALAYKCMEVAYMRVVYCKHSSTSRDRNELQATLQMVPQGESPSSSASDVDNLNNQATVDKASLSKGTVSHIAGNHVIVARNRPNFVRLLDFTQHVNFAMEASRKSQNAFAAASVALEEAQNRECITSVKRVIDFSFQDVEGLIRLVGLAMEAISRSGFGGARE